MRRSLIDCSQPAPGDSKEIEAESIIVIPPRYGEVVAYLQAKGYHIRSIETNQGTDGIGSVNAVICGKGELNQVLAPRNLRIIGFVNIGEMTYKMICKNIKAVRSAAFKRKLGYPVCPKCRTKCYSKICIHCGASTVPARSEHSYKDIYDVGKEQLRCVRSVFGK